jgi:hypothetical protein
MVTTLLVEIELEAHTVAIRNATKKTAAKMLASRPESLSGNDSSTRHLYRRRDMEVLASNNPLCLISHTGFRPYQPSKTISSVQNPDFEILFPQQMCLQGMMRPRNGQGIMTVPCYSFLLVELRELLKQRQIIEYISDEIKHIVEQITKFWAATAYFLRQWCLGELDGNRANLSLINSESIQNNNVNNTKEPPPPYLLDKMANDSETAGNQGQSGIDNPHALQSTSCSALLRVHQTPIDLMTTMHFQDYSPSPSRSRARAR